MAEMYTIQVFYHDGEAFSLPEESEGIALSSAEGISTHEIVEHVDVLKTVYAGAGNYVQGKMVSQYIDGYELPEEP
jgi:hypothetical protein